MSGLIRPSVLRQQPQVIVPIDRGNPIANGLLAVRTGLNASYSGVGPHGRYMARSGSSGYVNTDIQQNPTGTANYGVGTMHAYDQYTFAALVRRTNGNANSQQFAMRYRDPGNSNNIVFGLGLQQYNSNNLIMFNTPGGTISATYGGASPVPDTLFVVGTWDRIALVANLYINGSLAATSNAITNTQPNSGGVTMFDADANSGTTNVGFLPYVTMLFGRVVTDAEVKALYQNPWQVLKAPARTLPAWLLSAAIQRRALVMNGGQVKQIVDALLGTSLKPLVLYQGQVQERVAGEGSPIVLVNGDLKVLAPDETLLL